MPAQRRFGLAAVMLGLLAVGEPVLAQRATVTCSASVSPSSVATGSSTAFSFSLNNTGSLTVVWFEVNRPSGNFTITDGSASGWSKSVSGDHVDFTGGSLSASGSVSFTVTATAGSSAASSADWVISGSGNGDGSSSNACSGSLGTSISGSNPTATPTTAPGEPTPTAAPGATATPTPTAAPPVISNVVVSEVRDTHVKVTWTTDVASTSEIDYGLTSSYSTNKVDSSDTTSHSFDLDSLTANITYHYDVKSTVSGGPTAESGDNSFVTAETGSTGSTQTGTVTVTVTPSPTPADTTPPVVAFNGDFKQIFKEPPTVSGKAADDRGLAKIEYSTDGGHDWLPVETSLTSGDLSAGFSFRPSFFGDGTFSFEVRSTDTNGNVGYSKTVSLVIDRLPPRTGGVLYRVGPNVLYPGENGRIVVVAGLSVDVTLAEVGGPIKITLSTKEDPIVTAQLSKSTTESLWTGSLVFSKPGLYHLTEDALDGVGNIESRQLNGFEVLESGLVTDNSGHPLAGAKVALSLFDSTLNSFNLWDGQPYGQANPVEVDQAGHFALLAPSGRYYLVVTAPGWRPLQSDIFSLDGATVINGHFALERSQWFDFLAFLDFKHYQGVLTSLPASQTPVEASDLVGQEVPYFSLAGAAGPVTSLTLRGKPTVLTFVSSWHPQTGGQLAALNEFASKNPLYGVLVVVEEESPSTAAILKGRGGYDLPFLADPDGDLVGPLGVGVLPEHYFLKSDGTITKVVSGVLDSRQILAYLSGQ